MSEEPRDPVAYQWIKNHSGSITAIILILAVVGGIVAEIVGAIAGVDMDDSGWALAVLAAMGGGLVRFGYHIGVRARPSRMEQQIDYLVSRIDDVDVVPIRRRRDNA